MLINKMKRKYSEISQEVLDELINFETNNLVNVNEIYNYINNDTLVDWLNLYHKKPVYNKVNPILNLTENFKKKLVEYISTNISPVTYISKHINTDMLNQTILNMKKGVPLIYSAPLISVNYELSGVCDFLIRSDYINNLFDYNIKTREINIPSPKLNTCFHYVILHTTYSTTFLNEKKEIKRIKNYLLCKLNMLNNILGNVQGYKPRYCLLLSRRSRIHETQSYNCIKNIAKIDLSDLPNNIKRLCVDSIKWLRLVKMEGEKWSLYPMPSRKELFPNMCVDSGVWNQTKDEISKKIKDITQIWNVSYNNKLLAFSKGIFSIKDNGCNSQNLGIKGKRSKLIDKIIMINNQSKKLISHNKIKLRDVMLDKNNLYVDFETISDLFSDFNHMPYNWSKECIFMIGVGYFTNNKWEYKNFTCEKLSHNEEFKIVNKFIEFIKQRECTNILYWSAEKNIWKKMYNRQYQHNYKNNNFTNLLLILNSWPNEKNELIKWLDLYKFFIDNHVVIKDCYNYKLKSITKALFSNRLITTNYDCECCSGMEAQTQAWNLYRNHTDKILNTPIMKDIIKYNEIDCKILFELVCLIRKSV